MHQIHQLTDKLFQEMRAQFGRLGSLWEEIRAMVHRFYFLSMEALWELLAKDLDYEPPPRSSSPREVRFNAIEWLVANR